MSLQLRQGNIILEKVPQVPVSACTVPRSTDSIIVGPADEEGRAHVISSTKAVSFFLGRIQYIEVVATVQLVHEDHAPMELDVGIYKVIRHIDNVMAGHGRRVSKLALVMGEALGFDDNHLRELEFAARIHDVSVSALPEEIMWKPGPLTAQERSIMAKHAVKSANVVEKRGRQRARRYVLHHHEHFDGSGYPLGLKGDSIPIGARIISVADVYDALTTDRPYRKAIDYGAAIAELRSQGNKQLDARLVEVLVASLGNN